MKSPESAARATIVEGVSWERALDLALAQTRGIFPDLAILVRGAEG